MKEESPPAPVPLYAQPPDWEETYLLYIGVENGNVMMLELNSLIKQLNVDKLSDVTKQVDYDPYK